MNIYKQTKSKKIIAVILLTFFLISPFSYFKTAHATPGKDVPIDTMFNWHNIEQQLKSYVLDGLAWHVAKIMVQQITASTVQWINSGFKGSPAFLTNPEGFFMNVGDQITGDFISNTGILSGLCSPFSVDVRLNLALNQAGYGDKYTCTLSSVINNVGKSTINGASINGFMNGDFRQGGWAGFMSISQMNNNASGVYLQAQGDLGNSIASKQNHYQQQVSQGGGFLSWENCNDVDSSDAESQIVEAQNSGNANIDTSILDTSAITQAQSSGGEVADTAEAQANADALKTQKLVLDKGNAAGGATSIQRKVDPTTGAIQFQSCETKTPGSVINGQLSKQLGSGIDQLNLANSINEIVDAFLAQLVTQVLQKGLSTSSQRPSGITQSYIQQLSSEANSSSTYSQSSQDIQGSFAPYISTASQTVSTYGQILALFDNTTSALQADKTCFQNLVSNANFNDKTAYYNSDNTGQYNNMIDQINNTISQVTSSEATYKTTYDIRTSDLSTYKDQANNASSISDPNSLQSSSQYLQDFTTNQVPIIQLSSQTAQNDMTVAQTQVQQYQTQEQQFHSQCKASGGN